MDSIQQSKNMLNTNKLIGLTEEKAAKLIEKNGMKMRITNRDGESFFGTMDARSDRVNVAISKGKVTSADIG